MEISFSSTFKKSFRKRIESTPTESLFWESIELFTIDPFNPGLRTHKLTGQLKDLWSFSINYNVRAVFYFTKDNPRKAVLIDIGTHDEVY